MAFCKVMIIGNLGRDPEMRYTPTGKPVTQFSVAVNQSTKNQQTGEWIEETDWFRVSVFGDRAERAAEQLRKGNRVFVEGRFRTREFEGQDGQKRTSLDVTADNVISLEKRPRDDEARLHRRPRGGRRGVRRRLRWRRSAVAAVPARPPTTPTSTTFLLTDQENPNHMPPPVRAKKRDDFYRDRRRRKVCAFCADKTVQIDYKEVNRLRRYLSERAKIEPRRKTGTCAGHQRELAVALKRARHVALLPYAPQHLRP